ncbi:hypothetical protein EJ08DRAFT_654773, partial [Tothia fuscella]
MKESFLQSARRMWAFPLAMSLMAISLMIFLKDPKSEFTMHVDAPIEKENQHENKAI